MAEIKRMFKRKSLRIYLMMLRNKNNSKTKKENKTNTNTTAGLLFSLKYNTYLEKKLNCV